jgi:RNA polymerase sigma-70 factor (ECF subfamily)
LAAAIARADAGAENSLSEAYGPALRYILERQTQSRSVAEDIYQQTILIVIERLRLGSLREPDKLAGFMVGVARHLLQAQRRLSVRFRNVPEIAGELVAETAAPPEEAVIQDQEEQRLIAAIDRLRVSRDRDLLTRYLLKGEDRETICDALDLNDARFNSAVHRAKLRLTRELDVEQVGVIEGRRSRTRPR